MNIAITCDRSLASFLISADQGSYNGYGSAARPSFMDLFAFSIIFEKRIISSIWGVTFSKSFWTKQKNRNWRLTECEMLPWKRLDKYELANQSYLFWWFKKNLKAFFFTNCFHSTKRKSRKSHFSILVIDHCMKLNYVPIVCVTSMVHSRIHKKFNIKSTKDFPIYIYMLQ